MKTSRKNPDFGRKRHALKLLSGAAALSGLSKTAWIKPVVQSAVIPAHAIPSFDFTCEINFERDLHARGNSQEPEILKQGTFDGDTNLAGTYLATLPADAGSTGNCTSTGIAFNALDVTITITPA